MKVFQPLIIASSLMALCLSSYAIVSDHLTDKQTVVSNSAEPEITPATGYLNNQALALDKALKEITALKAQVTSLELAMKTGADSSGQAGSSADELLQIKQEVAALREQWENTVSAPQENPNGQDNVWIAEDLDMITEEQAYAHSQMIDRIDSSFQAEMVDNQWSVQTNDLILDAFNTEHLAKTDFVGTECRSSLCRVEVNHDNEGDFQEFQMWFNLEVGETLPSTTIEQKTHEDGSVSSIIYLAREGFNLPAAE